MQYHKSKIILDYAPPKIHFKIFFMLALKWISMVYCTVFDMQYIQMFINTILKYQNTKVCQNVKMYGMNVHIYIYIYVMYKIYKMYTCI